MRVRLISASCALLVVLFSFATPLAAVNAQTVPHYEIAKCKFDVPKSVKVTCGYLTVPEDRSVANGPTIRIAAAVFKAPSPKRQPDPIIYLDGGPGGHTLQTAALSYAAVFAGFGETRDFIMFDQRGVGYSEPALDCPESTAAQLNNLDKKLTFKDRVDLDNAAMAVCHDRLVKEGINLSAYNSAQNAADVNDLMHALGYKQWNLYGISYGTRLGLTVMRDWPDGVRSVILDSTVPLQVDLYGRLPANVDQAFQVFFQGCLKNLRCNTAYPNLDKVFYDLVAKLNDQPVTITVTQPITGKKFHVLVDGDTYINMLFHALYSLNIAIYLPKIIWDSSKGNFDIMTKAMGGTTVQQEFESVGMYYSVNCAEETAFDTLDVLENADKNFPKLDHVFNMVNYYTVCKNWNVKPAPPIERQPVTSTLPTLILSGEYDPITPPSYGYLASESLQHSFLFEFLGVGHGVSIAQRCPYQVTLTFLDKPTMRPDIGCMSTMQEPEFLTPYSQ